MCLTFFFAKMYLCLYLYYLLLVLLKNAVITWKFLLFKFRITLSWCISCHLSHIFQEQKKKCRAIMTDVIEMCRLLKKCKCLDYAIMSLFRMMIRLLWSIMWLCFYYKNPYSHKWSWIETCTTESVLVSHLA